MNIMKNITSKSIWKNLIRIGIVIVCTPFAFVVFFLDGNGPKVKVLTHVDTVTSPSGQVTSLLNKSETFVVPNLVHFVWFGADVKMRFHHFLSIKSACTILKPDKLMFHCNHHPVGKWWKALKSEVPCLAIVKREPPKEIFGNAIVRSEHKADVARIRILQEHGGIYLDTDVISLKSFDPLRKYNFTMGIEYHGTPGRLNNGIIVSAPNATFLAVWLNTYQDFSKREWDYHDSVIPYLLQFQYPELIHVEEKTLNYPSGKDKHLIYNEVYDWSNNYAMHLWYRLYDIDHGPNGILKMNNTFGQIARYIYYGRKSKTLSLTN